MHHRLLHLHQETSRSAGFKSNTRPCSTDLQHGHQRAEALSSAHITFGTKVKRYTEQRTHFTDSYFNSGKIKVENMNTRLNLRALAETIGVLSGNKKSVDTIDGQTLSSTKVEEPISCEALNPYGTGLRPKSTFLRRGTSLTIPPERLECGYITGVRKTTKFKRSPIRHQHVKFQNMANMLEHQLSRDHTGDPVETNFQ